MSEGQLGCYLLWVWYTMMNFVILGRDLVLGKGVWRHCTVYMGPLGRVHDGVLAIFLL
jgi:hypothetical protein